MSEPFVGLQQKQFKKEVNNFMICTPHRIFWVGHITKNEMGGTRGMCGRHTDTYRILVGRSEVKRTFVRPRCRNNLTQRLKLDGSS